MTAEAFWITWSQIPGVGAILIQRLQMQFGSLEAAWDAKSTELQWVDGIGPQQAEIIDRFRRKTDPLQFAEQHHQQNPHFWTPADPNYPRWLLTLPDPPPVLYYQGQVNHAENQGTQPAVAIVGTRRPSDYGRRWARRLSTTLAQVGFTVVSGLAEGIDTEAHQSCLGIGGRTIAVLGTGVDVTYPTFNQSLMQQIGCQGLLLSEFPAGTQPDRTHFPRRNRIIAGLCRATIVVEAPQKSGSLITARLANDYGREVYAVPASLDNQRALGCLHLINEGAQMILSEAQLLDLLGALPPLASASIDQLSLLPDLPPAPPTDLEPELQQVFQAVDLEPVAVDRIVQQAGLTTSSVLSALAQLEIMGLVTQMPGMRYQRA